MITDLNLLDVLFLITIALSIVFGVLKGFIRELLSLLFFVVAVVLAVLFYYDVGSVLIKQLNNRDVSNFTGFILVFTGVLVIGAVVTHLFKKLLTFGPLKSIDRILGGVFGLARGILISGIVVFGLIAFKVNDTLVLKSRLSGTMLTTVRVMYSLLPQKLKDNAIALKERVTEPPQ